MIDLQESVPGCLCLVAIPAGVLWFINGLSTGDYSLYGGVWAGPLLTLVAIGGLLFKAQWLQSRFDE